MCLYFCIFISVCIIKEEEVNTLRGLEEDMGLEESGSDINTIVMFKILKKLN